MNKKGKIIFLHSSTELYGASKILIYVMEITRKMGYDILLILPGEGPLVEEIVDKGFQVKIMNLGILRRKYFSPRGILDRGRKLFKAYQFLDDILQKEEIALVYSNTLAVVVGAIFARRRGLPHIWHIHEIIKTPRFLLRFLSREIDDSTPRPIMVSEAVAKHWGRMLENSKPEVIHNGIDYTPYLHQNGKISELPMERKIITMIGRVNPGKGQLFFLEIAKQVVESHPEALFVLVGDPYPGYENILKEVHSYIKLNNLQNHVIDLGFRKDVPAILQASDIFVLPSILPDSLPTVVLEAMATGLPVIATRSGGSLEMVEHEKTGFLIPIGDVKEGVARTIYLLENPEIGDSMGIAGQEKVLRDFSYEQFAHRIEKFICQRIPEKEN